MVDVKKYWNRELALAEKLVNQGNYDERRLKSIAKNSTVDLVRARALRDLGDVNFDQGRYAKAQQWYERARKGFVALNAETHAVAVEFQLGRIKQDQGYLHHAEGLF